MMTRLALYTTSKFLKNEIIKYTVSCMIRECRNKGAQRWKVSERSPVADMLVTQHSPLGSPGWWSLRFLSTERTQHSQSAMSSMSTPTTPPSTRLIKINNNPQCYTHSQHGSCQREHERVKPDHFSLKPHYVFIIDKEPSDGRPCLSAETTLFSFFLFFTHRLMT